MRPDDKLPLQPALEFLQSIWRLNHAVERASARMEARLGVTAQQRFILRCVGRYPGITPGQLAGLLQVDRGTISAALKRLERKEMLSRRVDPRDRRRYALGLTARGHALDRDEEGTVEAAVNQLLASTSPERIALTREALESLSALISAR